MRTTATLVVMVATATAMGVLAAPPQPGGMHDEVRGGNPRAEPDGTTLAWPDLAIHGETGTLDHQNGARSNDHTARGKSEVHGKAADGKRSSVRIPVDRPTAEVTKAVRSTTRV